MIEHASDSTFTQEVLEADGLTLVDFWAPWCGPCRMIAPILEEIATEYSGRLKVVKVNVDENPVTAEQFGIRSIPTLFFIKDGRPVGQLVGVQPKSNLVRAIDGLLASA